MDNHRSAGMSEAFTLTRAGRLTEALAVLQRTLGAAPAAGSVGTGPETPRLDPGHSQTATTSRAQDGTPRRAPAGCSTSCGPC